MAEEFYSVRCVLRHEDAAAPDGPGLYEERITLWRATSPDDAIAKAETEAAEYAESVGKCEYTGLAQSFTISDALRDGAELFSLVRESALDSDDYLDAFFDTGNERQQIIRSEEPDEA